MTPHLRQATPFGQRRLTRYSSQDSLVANRLTTSIRCIVGLRYTETNKSQILCQVHNHLPLSFVFNGLDKKLLCMVCHLFGALSARTEEEIVPHLRRSA